MGLAGGLATNGELSGGGGSGTVTSVTAANGTIVVAGTGAAPTVAVGTGIPESSITNLTSDLALKAPLASPTFTGTVTVPTTVNSTDAAQKSYVDGVAAGLAIKPSVQEATAAALPTNTYLLGVITITATGTLTVDGIAVALNDRVLVKNEVTQANNGIYVCTTFGTTGVAAVLTRSTDMNQASEIPGAFAFVEEGTVNAGSGWVVAGAGPYTIGTTAIVWTQFSGAGEIVAGSGLTLSGNTLSVTPTVVSTQQSGTTYTLALVDQSTVVEFTSATAVTVTIPANASVAFPVGTVIELFQDAAGQVTVAAAGGVTLRNPSSVTTRAQYSTIGVRQRAANEWVLSGDLT